MDDSYEWGTLPPGTKSASTNRNLTVTIKKNNSADTDNANGNYYSVVNMAEVRMDEGGDGDIKLFNCDQCTKVFSKKNQLQRHTRTHTGERPFTCKLCDKSFTRIDALKRHMASVGHKKQKVKNLINSTVNDGCCRKNCRNRSPPFPSG